MSLTPIQVGQFPHYTNKTMLFEEVGLQTCIFGVPHADTFCKHVQTFTFLGNLFPETHVNVWFFSGNSEW
jgi:hypothetical protein